ncbi:MAG: alpha/beta fold hydrolase [Marinobacter sp.]|uniref:esterase/lipase family protein n=1 Tax=Marinobacter sp. TaxID=50741 RepID=UPI00299E5215|nr:alpha/beta fold hydrolase [Marinobacter sp.]MDX1635902.1 alpha/beta fold hydrolase [Marinobacter sp.]
MTSFGSTRPWQDQAAAIASGFLGDWLQARANPLAIDMQLRAAGQVLDPSHPELAAPRRTLVLLVHGLTELETIWDFPGRPGHNYGTELAEQLGATALCLRYNTGRAIHQNGEDLAGLIETLVSHWPVPVENLVLLGHSMGGLVIRSACHAATEQARGWTSLVDACVYLGSPHEGSWLARAAQGTAALMNRMPRDYLRVIGEVLDVRSAGIRNLSRGDILENAGPAPELLPNARHYAISGLLMQAPENTVNRLFGDALVQEESARGAHQSGWRLTDYACFPGVDHIRLTHHPEVARQLREWLQ